MFGDLYFSLFAEIAGHMVLENIRFLAHNSIPGPKDSRHNCKSKQNR